MGRPLPRSGTGRRRHDLGPPRAVEADAWYPGLADARPRAVDARCDAVLAFADTTAMSDKIFFRPLAREAREGSRLRRALRYVPDDGYERCLPFRGLVRAEALRAAGPLRPSTVGEFDADGRWLFRLALLGPFVRVAEPLCVKRLHAESLAPSWSYDRRTWALDALTYIGEAHRAGLPRLEFAAFTAAAVAQGLLHLLPWQCRPKVSRLRTWLGV